MPVPAQRDYQREICFLRESMSRMCGGPRVLVVDDCQTDLDLISYELSKFKCEFSTVDDPEKALDMLGATAYDIVFVDIRLPKIDGPELIRRMTQCRPEARFVAVTGSWAPQDAFEPLRNGAFCVLPKPLTFQSLSLFLTKRDESK